MFISPRQSLLPVFVAALIPVAAAQTTLPFRKLEAGDFFTIFMVAIIAMLLSSVVLYRLLQRKKKLKRKSAVFGVLGSIIGLLLIAAASILLVTDLFVILTMAEVTMSFQSATYLFSNFFSDPVIGIILTGVVGLFIFVIGLYILFLVHGNPLVDPKGMPTVSGAAIKGSNKEEKMEPLNPTIIFRVISKENGDSAPDVKVMLKQRSGIKFYSKFTDFNGEVKFMNIEGYAHEYYAYVDGDEHREHFRVIQI